MTTSAPWSISGTGSKLQIENGGTLTANDAVTLASATTFQIDGGGTYVHNNTAAYGSTIFQGTESFAATSTVILNNSNTTGPSSVTFGNLTVNFTSTPSGSVNCSGGLTTVNGTLTITGTSSVEFRLAGASLYTLSIGGDLIIQAGTLNAASSSGANAQTIQLAGNYNQTGGTFTDQNTTTPLSFQFTGSGRTFTQSSGTLTNTNINWTINSGASLTLANNLPVAASRTVTVNGTLNCSTSIVSGAGAFTLSSGATLGIGDANGITSSGGTGNIQVTGTRTFDPAANYNYNGSAAQVTGTGLPSSVNATLAINNSAGVSLSQSTTVSGPSAVLNLASGDLSTASFTLFMTTSATSSGTGDVVGSVNRSDASIGTTRSFGNPDVQITQTGLSTGTDITVKLVKGSTPNDFTNSVKRIYTITKNGGALTTATLRLHYLDGELNGNTEALLDLYRKDATLGWQDKLQTTRHDDTTGDQNWVELAGVTSLSDWTLANTGLSPTDVAMLSAKATRFDNRVLLEWQTGYEVHNVGFNIYREKNGNLEQVTTEPVAGSALIGGLRVAFTAGLAYTWWDNQVDDTTTRYWIEDIDLSGRTTSHGPFPVQPAPAGQMLPPGKGNSPSLGAINGPTAGPVYGAQVQPKAGPVAATPVRLSLQSTLASAQAVKLSIKQAGWYHVEQSELVAAGLPASVDPHRLQLFVDGQEVPIIVTGDTDGKFDPGDAIEFYAIGIDSPSTDSHVYWLTEGTENGKRIVKVLPPARPAQPGASAFSFILERRDKVVYFPALKNGGGEKFFGPLIYNAQPVDQSLTIQNVAASGSGATLEVSLQGFTQTDHSARVVFNGTELGTVAFSGMAKAVAQYSIPQSALKVGANQVQFIGPPGFNDMSLVEYARLTYTHSNTADSNALRLSAAGRFLSTIGGFTSPAVRVIDVTVPNVPWELAVDVKKDASGFYTATVAAPGKGPRTLLAFTPDQQKKPAAMVLNQPSSWRYEFNAADYVVVTRKDLIDSLAPLVSQRRSQGLPTVVVDIEDVYDEFSFGNKTPQALKDFLSYSRSNWSTAPRFVLLAGDATYDPKNYLGVGDFDLVPTKLVEMLFNETATDDWFVDADGDGVPDVAIGRLPVQRGGGRSEASKSCVPDVAIGRLPVRNPAETAALVSKIVGYDSSTPAARVMLVADTNQGYDFESANQQLKSLIPSYLTLADIRRGQLGDSTARSQLLDGINQGQKVLNYYGHGSTRVWANAPLLTASDASAFTNQGALSLVSAMTCLSGYFHDPSIESLGEALLKAQGGAVAVWASSGMTDARAQVQMSQEAIKQLMSSPDLTIGEATARAKAATTDEDVRRTWILLGDPATKLR